ncbi:hypothetical protein [Alicyclobacillus fastidiosus]|uniref:Uncharacterized protein n=1 Tax=Alicyclobacillus fastidiosus TaxID=392011 RepID=A0ABV5AA39_9BACL|nr:hypothetical protein [Alicyclobacillus fastidiosus]WEH10967.1 hypothetical protein PYS47_07055 [Alicyclobacillus fastidiosus]
MSLEHEFYLIKGATDIQNFWRQRSETEDVIDSVTINDDVIQYILDTLNWIPSKNPVLAGSPNERGINYHGVTLFDEKSSYSLKAIFRAWRDLFENSPNHMELTGKFIVGDRVESAGQYETLVLERDEVIEAFEHIVAMAGRLGQGGVYLYHCGI